ncbi:inositol monophosphatase family protein [Rhizobium halophytocola]|uniref:Inositol-1-monophosphatase n=1 Tax=Rhizobium halophytocola TaxID=735519 RepID=A0ABS4DTX1_9HYPH|nr:inositol monophosphatase [Rhizobium halophytocola]MBP1849146.1 myo-inositol-1(or 4)-monophosphatase [Rhizobium halophytocola]
MQDQDIEPGTTARFATAKRIIRQAGVMAKDYFDRYDELEIETKSGRQDVVSVADRDVEDFIRREIIASFPLDGLIGEERGADATETDYTWTIDPIDGTAVFLHGLKSWCVAIAILKEGVPVAGLVYDPCADDLFSAATGHGAERNGRPIAVDSQTPFDGGFLVVGASKPEQSHHIGQLIEGILAAGGIFMRNGSAALTLAHVAAGHYLGYYEPRLSSWDCLAGLLIVREAGGLADDFLSGRDIMASGPAFAAAPQVHDQFKALTLRGT